MKNHINQVFKIISLSALFLFASCSSDDDSQPPLETLTIELTEVGHGTPAHVHAGSDLHLEAEIIASARIASIKVEIHHENDSSAPEIIKEFSNYNGQINALFHEHIDIPANQPAGDYHLHLTVIDQAGNTKTVEAELEIIAENNDAEISINITELGHGTITNAHAHRGDDMHIEGTITSHHPIATVFMEIHHTTNASAPVIEKTFNNYTGQTQVHFHEHVLIPNNQPTGSYHVHFTVTDNQGNTETVEYILNIV